MLNIKSLLLTNWLNQSCREDYNFRNVGCILNDQIEIRLRGTSKFLKALNAEDFLPHFKVEDCEGMDERPIFFPTKQAG